MIWLFCIFLKTQIISQIKLKLLRWSCDHLLEVTNLGKTLISYLSERNYDKNAFSEAFRNARLNCGLSQEVCAVILNVNRTTVQSLENPDKDFPNGDTLLKAIEFILLASDHSTLRMNDCIFITIEKIKKDILISEKWFLTTVDRLNGGLFLFFEKMLVLASWKFTGCNVLLNQALAMLIQPGDD